MSSVSERHRDAEPTSTVPESDERLAAVWRVLARLLAAPPDAATLATVQDPDWLAAWPLGRTPATEEGLTLIGRAVDPIDVADDHRQLFTGPTRNPVPPYESVHRGEDGLLFDDETFEVRRAYAEAGLQVPNLNREPDDHIALELEFCATLLLRGEAERHERFCAEHLLVWGPGFAEQVVAGAGSDFYRGVGMLLAEALRTADARA